MHVLQPKHSKLKAGEIKELLEKYNVSASQLPKIKKEDPCVPEGCEKGDVLKIERKDEGKTIVFFRIVA